MYVYIYFYIYIYVYIGISKTPTATHRRSLSFEQHCVRARNNQSTIDSERSLVIFRFVKTGSKTFKTGAGKAK